LLLPYPEYYAASISFYCDGSISHYLGRLARVLGRDDRALAHLTLGVERNRAFGLQACAAQSLFDLAMLLRESHVVRDLPRAQTLLRETAETAGRLGMRALQRAAAAHRNV
jgi:hypothetical protein